MFAFTSASIAVRTRHLGLSHKRCLLGVVLGHVPKAVVTDSRTVFRHRETVWCDLNHSFFFYRPSPSWSQSNTYFPEYPCFSASLIFHPFLTIFIYGIDPDSSTFATCGTVKSIYKDVCCGELENTSFPLLSYSNSTCDMMIVRTSTVPTSNVTVQHLQGLQAAILSP